MTFQEKILFHQIHPAKLGTDILANLISLYFFWQHALVLGIIIHFVPPIIASALIVSFVDLEWLKASAFGRYLEWHMTRIVETTRLAGDVGMIFGAWYRAPLLIAAGLLVIAFAWVSGFLRPREDA